MTDVDRPSRAQAPALRIVHLSGGLRAIDLDEDKVWIEVAPTYRVANMPTPAYADLYATLQRCGFHPLGVDFVTNHAFAESSPPDWQTFRPSHGFYCLRAERAWNGAKHAASKSANAALEALASKATTYLRLLPMRLRELSEAYNSSLHCAVSKPSPTPIGHHFSNGWTTHIDAAVHAFLSDATAFRDVLAETMWRILLGHDDGLVTSINGLRKKARDNPHPLLRSVIDSTDSGWLYQLGDLRNHIVHVAPVSDSQEHHFAELRALTGPGQRHIPTVHLPLLAADGTVRRPQTTFVNYSNEAEVRSSLEAYMEYSRSGRDALNVCEEFCFRLVELSMQVKLAAKIEEKEFVITGDDMIGPPTFY